MNDDKKSEIEKLTLEMTVVVTEKNATKKELDRMVAQNNHLLKEIQEQRINFDLMVDEISKVNR